MSKSPHPETPSDGEVTRLLRRWSAGERDAVDELLPLVYEELRAMAESHLRRERADHTLPPTALVHEAYLRLVGEGAEHATLKERRHFFAIAAQAMRRILVEHARRHAAARRPPPAGKFSFREQGDLDRSRDEPLLEVLAVHQVLDRLREEHPRKAEVVELRYFADLTEPEVAEVLSVSRVSVARDWRVARMLLARFLAERHP